VAVLGTGCSGRLALSLSGIQVATGSSSSGRSLGKVVASLFLLLGQERGTPFGTMGKGRGRCENGTSHGACRDISNRTGGSRRSVLQY
jgi:hypothetical protein